MAISPEPREPEISINNHINNYTTQQALQVWGVAYSDYCHTALWWPTGLLICVKFVLFTSTLEWNNCSKGHKGSFACRKSNVYTSHLHIT